jgi:alkylation response protein AidB-like acyl-CoA dehydrogenase
MINRVERLLANIQELAPSITSRVAETEAGRRIPPDLVEALRSIGIFRMFVPQSHGGLELDMQAALEIFRALSRIDGSLGWTAMIGGAHGIFASFLPRDTYEQIYQNGPDVIIAGSAQPVGRAEPVAGGWRVNGRWPFASGCQHAQWMFGFPRHDRRRKATLRTGRRGRAAAGPRRLPTGTRLADRGHLVRRRTQGYWEPSHHTQRHDRLGGEFLRSRERLAVLGGTALSSRAATASVDARRCLRRYSRGRLA